MKGKRILITGGGGFIGTSLAKRLAGKNKVTLLDLHFDKNAFAYAGLGESDIELVKANVLDKEALAQAGRDKQIIVHTAAKLGVREVIEDALSTLEVNYIGTSNLLRIANDSSCCERIVVFSSSEIFGANAYGVSESADSVLTLAQDVRWCYSISKLAAEHLAFSYYRQQSLPVVVVRPFNIFGIGRVGNYAMLRFILNALRNEDLVVYGNGTQIRAWCYIDDFCDALLQCMEVEGAVGQAFNIGNPLNTLTIYGLAEKIIRLCGSRSGIILKPPTFMDISIRIPNINKAKDILEFDPKIKIEDGLTRTIEWVKAHIDAFKMGGD